MILLQTGDGDCHVLELPWFSLSWIMPGDAPSLPCGGSLHCIAKGLPKKLTSVLLSPPDITEAHSWEREPARAQPEESSPSGLQRAAWGISETESDLTYGEVEQRLDLLQEQLNR